MWRGWYTVVECMPERHLSPIHLHTSCSAPGHSHRLWSWVAVDLSRSNTPLDYLSIQMLCEWQCFYLTEGSQGRKHPYWAMYWRLWKCKYDLKRVAYAWCLWCRRSFRVDISWPPGDWWWDWIKGTSGQVPLTAQEVRKKGPPKGFAMDIEIWFGKL